MSVIYTEHPAEKFIELEVVGRVTENDMNTVLPQVKDFIDTQGKIRMVEIIRDFEGFDLATLWPGMVFDFQNLRHISHVAVVSDTGWMGPVTRAAGAVLPIVVRTFPLAELDAARAWISDPDA